MVDWYLYPQINPLDGFQENGFYRQMTLDGQKMDALTMTVALLYSSTKQS